MLDYRPDLDPRTPNLLTAVQDMVPSAKGYRASFAETSYASGNYPPISTTAETYPIKLFATRWLSAPGGVVFVATLGSAAHIQIVLPPGLGYVDVSKVPGSYNLGPTGSNPSFQYGDDEANIFDFCAFGDQIIAAVRSIPTQTRSGTDLTGGTKFVDLTGAPAAGTCCVAQNFVFLGSCGSWDVVTGSPDILAWSAIGNYASWTVNPSVTQASFAQFNDTPGPITVVRPFRDGIVVFKSDSMYLGRYVGAGTNSPVWDFTRISDKIGCPGHRSVVNIDTALIFVGRDDIYAFDGTYPASITQGMYETLRPLLTDNGNRSMLVGHNKPDGSVWFVDNTNSLTYVWSYHFNRWGRLSNSGRTIPCQTNSDDFRVKTLLGITSSNPVYILSTGHFNLYTLTFVNGTQRNRNTTRSTNGAVYTGVFGQADLMQSLSRVSPVFSIAPATSGNASATVFAGRVPATVASIGTVAMTSSYRMDTLGLSGSNNNYFKFALAVAEDFEVMEINTNLQAAGAR